jgi:hypothetical protein
MRCFANRHEPEATSRRLAHVDAFGADALHGPVARSS